MRMLLRSGNCVPSFGCSHTVALSAAAQHGLMSLTRYRSAELTHQWEFAFVQWTLLVLHWYDCRIAEMREGTRVLRSQWETQKDVVWSFWIHTHAAHLTDLVEGRGAERAAISKDSLHSCVISRFSRHDTLSGYRS